MKGAFGNEGALLFFGYLIAPVMVPLSKMIKRFAMIILLVGAVMIFAIGLCFFGVWIPNKPSLAKYPIRGIDVSHHQRDIHWGSVKASGIRFAYIKATEGADFKDEKFAQNWGEAGEAGIARGAYHFFTLGTAGSLQASNFIATVPVTAGALPPAIDLEFSGWNMRHTQSSKDFQRELSVFWDTILAHYGATPVVYTVKDFESQYLAQMPIERLWIREVILKPPPPWMFWQFSSRGRVPGISTFVDLNVFNGSAADFEMLLF
jgi:lysozyme